MTNNDKSLKEQINTAYEKALGYYDTLPHESPLKYDIEIIEGTINRFYKLMSGECSLQASIDFDMQEWTNNIVKYCDNYCRGISLN